MSLKVSAALPNCDTVISPNPGNNCLLYGLPLCSQVSNPDHRVNCMNVIDLPLCSEFSDAEKKPLGNCVNECDPNQSNNAIGNIHNKNCIRFCNIGTNFSELEGANCINPKCHQVLNPVGNGIGKNCEMANCIYLTKDELDNTKFSTDSTKYCEGNTNFCFEFSKEKLQYLIPRSDNKLCKLHYCKPRNFYCGRDFAFDYQNLKGDQTIDIKKREQDPGQEGFVAEYERTILKTYKLQDNGDHAEVPGNLDETSTCDNSLMTSCKAILSKEIYCGTSNTSSDCTAPASTCNANGKCLKATFECMTAYDFTKNLNLSDASSPIVSDACLLNCTGNGTIPANECNYSNTCSVPDGSTNSEGKYCKKIINCNSSLETDSYCTTKIPETNDDTRNISPYPETESWFYRPSPSKKSFKNNTRPKASDNALEYQNEYRKMQWDARNDSYKYNICYHEQDLNNNNFGNDTGLSGFFHSYLLDDTRSPGNCSKNKFNGTRAFNYEGLCGVMTAFEKVYESYQTAYFEGYVVPDYNEGKNYNNTEYKVRICTRFNNIILLNKTCGTRECGIEYSFGNFQYNICGSDVCKTLTIKDSDPKRCIFANQDSCTDGVGGAKRDPNLLCKASGDEPCVATIDDNLRVRVVKYDNYVCAFLDTRDKSVGHTGSIFLTNEDTIQLVDEERHENLKYCMTGDGNKPGIGDDPLERCPNAFNYKNQYNFLLTNVWRPFYQIPYVDNSYYMHDSDILVRKQKCAKIELKASPRRAFAIANRKNSPYLFVPQLYISKVFAKKGSDQEVLMIDEANFNATDFFQPKIEISLGEAPNKVSKIFELDINEDTSLEQDISVPFVDTTYTVRVFIKKLTHPGTGNPLVCAYRVIVDSDPLEIGCVPRKLPLIGQINSSDKITEQSDIGTCSSTNFMEGQKDSVIISLKDGSDYDGAFARVQLKNSSGCNTNPVEIEMPKELDVNCNSDLEKYRICIQREECSQLNIERVINEIAISNAYINNESVDDFIAKREKYELLQQFCNQKNPDDTNMPNNYYGWFNEICIVSGFKHDLKNVIAYKINNNIGKCIIDDSSIKTEDNNYCTDGGNPRLGCYCKIADENTSPSANQTIRKQTLREAGLCVDIPEPKLCPAITFIDTTAPDYNLEDKFYVQNSLGITRQEVDSGAKKIHHSHIDRTQSRYGHAEFNEAFEGSKQIGACNGYWQQDSSKGNVTMNCSKGGDWDVGSIENMCIRYRCQKIQTGGNPDENGEYPNIVFDMNEEGENKGYRYGFATWPEIISSDVAQVVSGNQCITGFKPKGSGYKVIGRTATIQDNNASNIDLIISNSQNNKMDDDYSSSSSLLPTMKCDQEGHYNPNSMVNRCERIKCYFKDPPAIISDISDYEPWNESGGAIFTPARIRSNQNTTRPGDELLETAFAGRNYDYSQADYGYAIASRSNARIQDESKIYGECNNNLGFFKVGEPPYRECDHKGNLSEVKNKCATECRAVTDNGKPVNNRPTNESSENDGFALWNAEIVIAGEGAKIVNATSCKDSSYLPYPYTPLRDNQGNWYKARFEKDVFEKDVFEPYHIPKDAPTQKKLGDENPIEFDISLDNRTEGRGSNPKRSCVPVSLIGAQDIANTWSATNSDCISRCPGFDQDSRIGVGSTLHPFSRNAVGEEVEDLYIINNARFGNNKILIKWPETNFGEWSHIDFNNDQALTTGDFGPNRPNNYFSLSRKCNSDGTWGKPVVNCIANGDLLAEGEDNITLTSKNTNNSFEYRVPSKNINGNEIPNDISTTARSQCRTNYYYPQNASNINNIDLHKLKEYSCQPFGDENYIDKYYFKNVESSDIENYSSVNNSCTKKCQIQNEIGKTLRFSERQGSTFLMNENDNSTPDRLVTLQINSSNAGKLYNDGQNIDGSCPSNYGNQIQRAFSHVSDVAYNCNVSSIRNDTDRSQVKPYLTCFNFDSEPERPPQWQSRYPCQKCRDCTIGSDDKVSGETKISGNEEMCVDKNWNEMRFKYWYYDLPSSIAHNSSGSKCRYHAQDCYDPGKFCNTRADLKYTCKDSFLSLYWTASDKDCNNERHSGWKNDHDEQCKGRGQCLDCHQENCNGLSSIPLGAGANASASDSAWDDGRGCPSIQKP